MKPEVLSKRIEYKGIWFKIEGKKIKLPTGKIVRWENIVAPDFVAIVAIDDKKNIYLSKEWRSAWEKEILQIPAGSCKSKKEKAILRQAHNELREEIGLDAKKWERLVTCPSDARRRTKVHIFLATDLCESKKRKEDSEIIEVIKMPFDKAYKLFLEGKELTTSYTILGMALAKEKLNL